MDGYSMLLLAIFRKGKRRAARRLERLVASQNRQAARLIVKQTYGKLPEGAVVHHINGNPRDNHPGNLLVCTRGYHSWLHGEMSRRYAQEHF